MKEVSFIKRNIDKWKAMEDTVDEAYNVSPDVLADAYQELTADLAFSQTHFPDARITVYLNNLASALHNKIYRNKREKRSRIITFWTREVPLTMWEARRLLLASFLIFVVSVVIGVLSTLGDADFPRLIMGDGYVDMTLNNIEKGEPMGVYGSEAESPMFFQITLNNIMVSFRCFVAGLLTSFMTGFILMQNGIMVGAFQAFFYQHGLLWESSLAIWLHGTIEISSIVVAGAAGLSLGNGWLMPGTYTRLESFRRGAVRGMKIVVGTVPLFIIAGFIESFVTRHTDLADGVRLSIIVLSLFFVVSYFVVLPWHLYGRKKKQEYGNQENRETED
ncbi:MAG: stage II sporulation protein M [Prevotella sp.]|nr:stage II sporulation protein M [Prevotella sp.]